MTARNPQADERPPQHGTTVVAVVLALCVGLAAFGCGGSAPEVTSPSDTDDTGDTRDGEQGQTQAPRERGGADEGSERPESQAVSYRFDPAEIPSQGPADAAVVVDIFSDFECPYCSLARRNTARLLEDFPSVRVRYRHYPLAGHPHSGIAAEAAVEAYAQGGNEAFWCFHDQVFDHQTELSRDLLYQLATRCHVQASGVRHALTDHRHQARVEQDRAAGDELGLQGTPTFAVNGTLVEGGDYTDIEEAVDRVHPRW